jgi:hypothetical protein
MGKNMTDQQPAFQAVSDTQRISEEYLQRPPQTNERHILVSVAGGSHNEVVSELRNMTRQFRSIALIAFIAALSSIEISTTEAKQQCNAEMPSNPHGQWWSYRLIDGRKCWYEGKPGLSKSLLEWPGEASARSAPDEEVASTVQKPRNPPASQVGAPNSTVKDRDTFEARWVNIGPRAPIEAIASGPEVDGPPLAKADRLPSPYLDGGRSKMTRTLVTIPDQPQPAVSPATPR